MWYLKAVGEIGQTSGETMVMSANITGEMKPEDIPLAPGVNIEALKAGDQEPMEVVVEIPAGKSTRGWNYLPSSLQSIVKHVQTQTLSGFLGHQRPEDVSNKFEAPVTHWVGAKWQDNKAYFRGVVDSAAKDLKRWIKAGRVKQVSIYGMPKLQQASGETQVIDYNPLSIDWTPLNRAGMPTRIVTIGEMDDFIGGGQQQMGWKELVQKLKAMVVSDEVTIKQIAGEMGWTTALAVAGEIDGQWTQQATGAIEQLAKVREALGVTGEMDIVTVAKDAAKAVCDQRVANHTKMIDDVIKEKVAGEMAQGLVKKMLRVPEAATKEQITGEIDKILADESLKETFSKLHIDKPAGVGPSGKPDTNNGLLKTKRVAI